MRNQSLALLSVAFFVALSVCCFPQEPSDERSFPAGIILIGASTFEDPKASTVQVMSPAGGEPRSLFRLSEGSIFTGRLSPQGDRLAYSYASPDGKQELWMVNVSGKASKLADRGGSITAWSPDGKQLAFYRAAGGAAYESFVVDLATKQQTKLDLPPDYVGEDWHPSDNVRTAIYMNPRNLLYRPQKGDHYPTRQLDLLMPDGKTTPITRNPSTDNIWSRFSPAGDRLVHYQRHLVGEKSYEAAVVCNIDGSQASEVLGFTKIGDANGLPWFRPRGLPAWSPEGKSLAWLVNTNDKPQAVGESLELVIVGADGKNLRRFSLSEQGYRWVSAIDWR